MLNLIKKHAGTIGGIIVLASMIWLMGVAGADTAAELQGMPLTFTQLLERSILGFAGLGVGALVLSEED